MTEKELQDRIDILLEALDGLYYGTNEFTSLDDETNEYVCPCCWGTRKDGGHRDYCVWINARKVLNDARRW